MTAFSQKYDYYTNKIIYPHLKMARLLECLSPLPIGLLIFFLSLSSPAKTREYQQEYQNLVDLVRSPKPLIDQQVAPNDPAEVMTEMIRDYEINLSAVAKKMTLNESISLALERNPNIVRQYKLYEGLVWDSISTQRKWIPALNLDSPIGYRNKTIEKYSLSKNDPSSLRDFRLQDGSNLKPELKISWSLLNLSRNSLLQTQRENIFSQVLRFRQDVRDLVLNVQSDYFDLQRARQEEDVFNGIYIYIKNLLQLSDSEQLSQESDEILAALKARLLQALSLRVSAQQNVVRLSASLASRLALPPDSFILPSQKLGLNGRWEQELNDTISRALDRREEIKISNSQSKAANNRANSLVRKYFPEITAEAIGKLENDNFRLNTNASNNTSTVNSYTLDKSVGVRVKWAIFDSGVLAAQSSSFRKKAQASQEQAALNRLEVEAQIKTAYSAYTSQLIQLPVVNREIDQTLLSLQVRSEQANRYSASSVTNLILALDQYQSAASRWFATLQKYNEAIAQLYRYSSKWPPGVASQISSKLNYIQGINMEDGL